MKKIKNIINVLLNKKKSKGMRAKLIKDGSYSMVITVASKGFSMLIGVLLVRILGTAEYGVYTYVLSLVYALTIPAEFGIPNLIVRETAQSVAKNTPEVTKGVWRWSMRITLILSGIIVIAALVVAVMRPGLFEKFDLATVLWGISLVLLLPIVHMTGAALRGLKEVVLGQVPDLVIMHGVYTLLLIIFMFITPLDLTSASAMALRALATLIALISGIGLLLWKLPKTVKQAVPEYHGKAWFGSALPLGLSSGLSVIKNRASILILGLFATTSQIGIYQVGITTAALAGLVLQVINTILAPQFASLFAQGEMKKLQRLVTTSARLALFFNLAATLVFIFFGKFLLALLFGPELVAAYVPLLIILAGQMVNSMAGSVGFLLNMTGHEKDVMKALGISVVLSVIVNLIFTPLWGINGAALATALSLIFIQIYQYIIVRQKLKINSFAFGKDLLD